ncbi:MAG: FTR1 family protein [Actinobacteria bacterium]|nr:FTR1 family protein [Actinomycetota bacterium]
MLSTFIIALREGLEASLIVGILLAYVKKTGRTQLLRPLWLGVSAAIVLSLGVGAGLNLTSSELSDRNEEIFAGTASVLAVIFVTAMVFWMKRTAKTLRGDLHGKLDASGSSGLGMVAVVATAFFAVVREGLETALFLYSNFNTAGGSYAPAAGLVIGLASAVLLGYLLYKRAVTINLGRFFTITGVALIIVAAGVLSYAVHEFQEVGWLPGEDSTAWSIDSWLSPDSFVAGLLAGSIGFRTTTSWLQVGFWVFYLVSVLTPYLMPASRDAKTSDKVAKVTR